MATSNFPTTTYPSTDLTESCGAILFDLPTHRICLVAYTPPPTSSTPLPVTCSSSTPSTEHLLPKGRRNLTESRSAAALREVGEETGYACEMLDVSMGTRCPPAVEADGVSTPDEVRVERVKGEGFVLQVRQLAGGRVKLIWWFIARTVREEGTGGGGGDGDMKMVGAGEEQFKAVWYDYETAVGKLTFENDREIARKAIEIVRGSGY